MACMQNTPPTAFAFASVRCSLVLTLTRGPICESALPFCTRKKKAFLPPGTLSSTPGLPVGLAMSHLWGAVQNEHGGLGEQ